MNPLNRSVALVARSANLKLDSHVQSYLYLHE
jgi:hypothetical protein